MKNVNVNKTVEEKFANMKGELKMKNIRTLEGARLKNPIHIDFDILKYDATIIGIGLYNLIVRGAEITKKGLVFTYKNAAYSARFYYRALVKFIDFCDDRVKPVFIQILFMILQRMNELSKRLKNNLKDHAVPAVCRIINLAKRNLKNIVFKVTNEIKHNLKIRKEIYEESMIVPVPELECNYNLLTCDE